MTTAANAVAEARRLAPIIQRIPYGWNSRVNVQDWAPNTPKYSWASAGRVDHCGCSLNTVNHNIGLTVHVDFPDSAWTPAGLAWFRERGRLVAWEDIQPGDYVYFRNAGSPYSATHVGMATSGWLGGGFNTIEFNTTYTGLGIEYYRTPGYAVAVGRPAYTAPVAPSEDPTPEETQPSPTQPAHQWAPDEEDDMPALINVHADGKADEHLEFWFMNGGVPSRVVSDGVEGPPDQNISKSEWDAWLQAWSTARGLVQDVAWVGPAQRRPVFRPKPPTPAE